MADLSVVGISDPLQPSDSGPLKLPKSLNNTQVSHLRGDGRAGFDPSVVLRTCANNARLFSAVLCGKPLRWFASAASSEPAQAA